MSVDQVLRKARRHASNGEVELAAQKYQSILDKYPKNRQAIEGLKGLQKENSAPYQEQINQLASLFSQGKFLETLEKGQALAKQFPDIPLTYNLLGAVNVGLGRFEQAAESYSRALQIKPDYAEVHNNLGNTLLTLGKSEQALESYETALQFEPGHAEAHRNLSAVKKYQDDDPQIFKMQQLMERQDLADKDRMHVSFALGKAYSDIGKYDQAFHCLSEGNCLRKKEQKFEIAPVQAVLDNIISMFAEDVPSLSIPECHESGKNQRPIFIVGMPRSGSTLVEQIIASHSRVYGAGEMPLLNSSINSIEWGSAQPSSDQLKLIRKSYLSGLSGIGAAESCITDKMPDNFWWIGFIIAAMPEAKIIHVKRDARATCWSNFKSYFSSNGNGFAYDLKDVTDYYKKYVDMMTFWSKKFPAQIHDLSYEALTENQERETRVLLEYCDLNWEDQCLEFHQTKRAVQTASEAQVRQKMYQGSSDQWRNYEKHLESMINALKGF